MRSVSAGDSRPCSRSRVGIRRGRHAVPAILTAFLVLVSPARGQDRLSPDRPGLGSGTTVLDRAVTLLETGAQIWLDDGEWTLDLGQALVRHGVAGIELQLLLNSFTTTSIEDATGDRLDGFRDLFVGAKVPVRAAASHNVSLLALVTVPTRSAVSSREWVPSLVAIADRALSDRTAIALNAGWAAGPGDLEPVWSLILTPSAAIGERTGVYAGYAGFYSGTADQHFLEGGLAFTPSPDLQFDLNSGWETRSGGFFIGAGAAVRWRPGR